MSQPHGEGVRIGEAAAFLRQRLMPRGTEDIALGIVLGSGLAEFARSLQDPVEVPFAEVPHWPLPKVAGHGGSLVVGTVGGARVACLGGRVHLYEGWSPLEATRAVRTLRLCGIGSFLLTNAAGGISENLSAGDLMVLVDHLNLTGMSPLTGPHDAALGPRFPDQSHVYCPELRALLLSCGSGLQQGVYAGWLGPTYETPAEVRMLKTLGADSVGMSTVHEAMALSAMGAKVCALSLISNLAAGISEQPLSHDEVMAEGKKAADQLCQLVAEFCRRLGAVADRSSR